MTSRRYIQFSVSEGEFRSLMHAIDERLTTIRTYLKENGAAAWKNQNDRIAFQIAEADLEMLEEVKANLECEPITKGGDK